MAQLKRILAGAMALCMAGAVFTACGDKKDDDSSSKSGSNKTIKDVEPAKAEDLVNTGKKYNIYVWNTEFKERFEKYYWDQRDEALWDGVEVNWVTNPNDDNNYQTKLDEAIKGQNDAAAGDPGSGRTGG